MRAMIEIEWMDGLVTKVPEFALGDVFGESVQVERFQVRRRVGGPLGRGAPS